MGYKILIDSCGEIPQSLMSTGVVENIPLSIMVEDETIIDDETFDQKSFLEKQKLPEVGMSVTGRLYEGI